MAVVYVAARIKAGSSMSPLKGATRRSIGPFGTLPRGAFCYLTRGQPVSFLLPSHPTPSPCSVPPFFSVSLRLYRIEGSLFSCLVSLSSENSGGMKDVRTHDASSIVQPLPRVGLLQPARGIPPFFLCQGLRGW